MKLGKITGTYVYSNSYTFNYSSIFSNRSKLREASVKNLVFNSSLLSYNNLDYFFNNCPCLESFDFGETDTSLNPTIACMFQGCKAITSIDLSWMATNSVTNAEYLFNGCSSLKEFDFTG